MGDEMLLLIVDTEGLACLRVVRDMLAEPYWIMEQIDVELTGDGVFGLGIEDPSTSPLMRVKAPRSLWPHTNRAT